MKTTFNVLLSVFLCGKALADLTNMTPENAVDSVTQKSGSHIFIVPAADGSTNTTSVDMGNCVLSRPRSNIFYAFRSSINDASYFPADKPIWFGFGSTTNYSYYVFMLRPEYGYRILARSEDGQVVKPTRLGASYGEKFDKIKGYDEALDWTRGHGGNSVRPFMDYAHRDLPSLDRIFPSPQELFNFDKPGKYTMWIELQCLSRSFLPNATNIYLVRFPPIQLQVIKN